MNYIYDIVLNFQDNYYQFFEWNRTDKIKNISKIAVYHVRDQDLLDLTYNKITIDTPFLDQLKEDNKKYKKLMCLVSNTTQTIGLLFSNEGKLLKRSSLLFEEETEVNDFVKDLKITEITYTQNEKNTPLNKLRIEIEKKDNLINYITENNDILKLKYLYYEYFEKECDNINIIKKSLLKEINKEWTTKQNNLYKLTNMFNKNTLTK